MKTCRLLLLFLVLSAPLSIFAQSKKESRNARAYEPIKYGISFKGSAYIIPIYYLYTFSDLSIEYTHKNFHSFYIGQSKTKGYTSHSSSYYLGYNYPLQKRIFPFYIQLCTRYVQAFHSNDDGEWSGPFTSNDIKGGVIQLGLGKKLRLIGNFRLETTIGIKAEGFTEVKTAYDNNGIIATKREPFSLSTVSPYLNLKFSLSYFNKKHVSQK